MGFGLAHTPWESQCTKTFTKMNSNTNSTSTINMEDLLQCELNEAVRSIDFDMSLLIGNDAINSSDPSNNILENGDDFIPDPDTQNRNKFQPQPFLTTESILHKVRSKSCTLFLKWLMFLD